jgi:SAM-dependent methyltransferase
MTLVEATPKAYLERGSFQIPEPEEVSGVTAPVVSGGRLYLRDNNRLLCYDVGGDALAKPPGAARTLVLRLDSAVVETNRSAVLEGGGEKRVLDAIFVTTPMDVVQKMLECGRVTRNSVVYDLGSGDGRIVIAASRQYGCRSVGYEIDSQLVELSRASVRTNGLERLVRIEQGDMFKVDLSAADVIAVYLPTNVLQRLRPQFEKLKPGARIVSHQFQIPGIAPESSVDMVSRDDGDRHKIFLWTVPLKAR